MPDSASPRVLIVEDDDATRQLIESVLTDEGYTTLATRHGAEALRFIHQWEPDLILLDLWMPVMDGEVFLYAYRQAMNGMAPVIALTASDEAARFAARAYPFINALIVKPFDLDELLHKVERHTQRKAA